jgi:glutamine amidotransferase
MISVIDYGLGNIGSVGNMLRRLGVEFTVCARPDELINASGIILPGVGAFDYGMQRLDALGFSSSIRQAALEGQIPVLGICLGMQLLLTGSDEGSRRGLDLIPGHARKFSFVANQNLRIPHMGWSSVSFRGSHPLCSDAGDSPRFYFVHSYFAECSSQSAVLATATYGHEFAAVIGREKILGAQFHPEKSHRHGLQFFRNFLAITQ